MTSRRGSRLSSCAGQSSPLLHLVIWIDDRHQESCGDCGQPSETGRRMVGYVPQYTQFDRVFPVRVIDVVLMGRLRTAPLWGRYRAEDRNAAH